jgi:tRNA(fMet)-specific endonuclease VapC
MDAVLVDTDILSSVMRKEPRAYAKAHEYLAIHGELTISMMTRYEILRGLMAKQAVVQLSAFDRFCGANIVLPLTEKIIIRAAGIYGELHRGGALIGDGDILIAATALESGLSLVTNNTDHFNRISGLQLLNWLEP